MPATTFRMLADAARSTRSVTIQQAGPHASPFRRTGLKLGGFLEDHDQLDLAGRHEIDIRETLQMHPVPELRGLPELHSPHTTNGTWDRIAEIRTDSLTDFDRVLREARTIDGVLNSEPSILPSSA